VTLRRGDAAARAAGAGHRCRARARRPRALSSSHGAIGSSSRCPGASGWMSMPCASRRWSRTR
jgi:hypothetical protein